MPGMKQSGNWGENENIENVIKKMNYIKVEERKTETKENGKQE